MTETVECPVCIEVMTEVNTIRLDCSHAVCIACEQRMMKTPMCMALTDFDLTTIKCPICRNVAKPTYDDALKAYNVKKRIISQLKTANTEHLNRMHAYRRENDELRRQIGLISNIINSNVNQHRNARSQRAQHRSNCPVVAPAVTAPPVVAPVVAPPVVAPVVVAPPVTAPTVVAPTVVAPTVVAPVVEEGEIVENPPVVYESLFLFPSNFATLQFCQGVKHYNHIDDSRRRTRTRKHCVTCPTYAACNDCNNECHTCREDRLNRRMTQLQYGRYISSQTVS